ncbi:MAG: hypothetical protein HYT72_03750 [Candidatus Aenigmarchaeota archaeon]|nr:hypothetical protein [Candidatus Aenigmarchaeota archaeon]
MSELIILSAEEISEINKKFNGGARKGGIEFILSRIRRCDLWNILSGIKLTKKAISQN